MSLVGLTLLWAALGAGSEDEVPSTPAKVHMVAVQALKEAPGDQSRADGRTVRPGPGHQLLPGGPSGSRNSDRFGPGLAEVRRALAGLDYASFRRLRSEEREAAYEKESRIPINDRYTLYVKPMAKDGKGRIRVNVRIEMAPRRKDQRPINALSNTTIALVPGEKVNLGGLRLDKGDLIVVLWARD